MPTLRTVLLVCAIAATGAVSQSLATPRDGGASASGFAAAVAFAGEDLLVGRTGAEVRMATYPTPGALYVYRADPSGRWGMSGELLPSDRAVGDLFGASVAVEGDRLLVGAPGADETRGVGYVFERVDETWIERARLDAATDENAGAGTAVAIAGDVVFLGAPGGLDDLAALGQPADPQRGEVIVFVRTGEGDWELRQRLTSPGDDDTDRFGASLVARGDDLFVGAPRRDGTGAVYHFRRDGDGWSLAATLGPEGEKASFGHALALHGEALLVSAPGHETTGGVYVFADLASGESTRIVAPEGSPGRIAFGTSLASDNETLLVGAAADGAGDGRVHAFAGAALEPLDVVAAADFGPGSAFGTSVAVSGSVGAVGAALADLRLGAAAILARDGGSWRVATGLHDPARTSVAAITGEEVRCEDGEAKGFACSDVDLVAFLPLDDLGAGPASIANDIWGWTDPATGREYVLLGKSNGTSFVDITDASDPLYLGELPLHDGANENLWRDIKTYANHAFIVADGAGAHGVQIFDLTQLRDVTDPPRTFEETGHYDGVFSSHNIVINEETGTAYAVGNSGGGPCGGGLHMLDVRDPRSPVFAGCYNDAGIGGFAGAGYTHDAQCVLYDGPDERYTGREICFHASISALAISDVTDRENPVSLSNADYPGVVAAHQGWLSEDRRYFFMGDELDEDSGTVGNTRTLVWDVAELDDPVLVTEYYADTRAIDHNQYVRGDYLYQSNLMAGLRILDISNPENPVEVAFFDTVPQDDDATAFGGSWSNYPFFPSGVIAVSSWNEGLFILRKREPALVP
ncbi:MAG: choice-of-anchor B family protein [Gemmatimonadota bacterium]|nr:choice-of-anchor B family protein [Gemmatimonadota bacterium]